MQPTHSIASPNTDACPRSPSALPEDQWLRLGEVAAAIAVGAATWPERHGGRSKCGELTHG